MQDIRWHQRLENYEKALEQLLNAVHLSQARELSDLEKQGLIQAFEFTHELAWNLIKDYFQYQGNTQITGSRDAAREAFQKGLIKNGQEWMEMISSRNKTLHTYNKSVSEEITQKIIKSYSFEFVELRLKMKELKSR